MAGPGEDRGDVDDRYARLATTSASGWRLPPRQRVASAEDLAKLVFVDDVAEIDVPVEFLDSLPLKNDDREDSPRLRALKQAIRANGYSSLDPVICRLGRKGRWVVLNGGHRITAAREVSREFFTNLFGRKVRYLQFLLFRTPYSNIDLGKPDDG